MAVKEGRTRERSNSATRRAQEERKEARASVEENKKIIEIFDDHVQAIDDAAAAGMERKAAKPSNFSPKARNM